MPNKKKDPTVKLLIAIAVIVALAGVAIFVKSQMNNQRSSTSVKWNKSGEYLKSRYQKTKR